MLYQPRSLYCGIPSNLNTLDKNKYFKKRDITYINAIDIHKIVAYIYKG